jgi:WD40 repeat protein
MAAIIIIGTVVGCRGDSETLKKDAEDEREHAGPVLCLTFAPDGKTLASASEDGTAKLWEVTEWKELGVVHHDEPVYAVLFAPDGKTLITGSWDRTIVLWDAATKQRRATLRGHKSGVVEVGLTPDGKTLVSGGGSGEGGVRVWDLPAARLRTTLVDQSKLGIDGLALSPDGKTVATVEVHGNVKLWNLADGKIKLEFDAPIPKGMRGYCKVAFAPDGKTLATSDISRHVRIFEAATGKQVKCLTKDTCARVSSLAFSPGGKFLVVACPSEPDAPAHVTFWNVETGEECPTREVPRGSVSSLAFSPDGKLLALGYEDGKVSIQEGAKILRKEPKD